jgi:hypothetical protein
VHLVGPDGRVEFKAAGNRDDFLAVGHAAGSDNARDGDALGAAGVAPAELSATTGACGLLIVGASLLDRHFLAALRAYMNVIAEWDLERFEHVFFVEAKSLTVGDVADVGAKFAVGPEKISDVAE